MNKQKNLANAANEELLRKIEQVSSLSSYCEKPPEGWIRTIRTFLNMSTAELGKRITTKDAEGVLKLEEDEIQGRLMPKHLQNIGKILGGRFEYIFIPENINILQKEFIPKIVDKNADLLKKTEFFLEPLLSTSSLPPLPLEGWISTLRHALKVSRPKLQKNLNIPYSCIQSIEESETSGQLVNKMLRRAANVLGYHIEYIFVPIKNLHRRVSFEDSPLLTQLQQLPPLPQKPVEGWICAIRKSQGITQAELAERLKITERKIIHLEKNEAHDGLTYTSKSINVNLNELAKALGCRFDYILIKDSPLYDETILRKFHSLVPFPPKPRKGWISKIRDAQELTHTELAKQLNYPLHRISVIACQEARTIPISKSDQDIIRALQCRVEYVLIPQNFETMKIHPNYIPLFEELKQISSLPFRPYKGWLYWLRCSLEMTQAQLAGRIGISQEQLSKFEWKEAHNQLINMRIKEVVKAMGCRLEYRIVPNAVPQRVSILKQDTNNKFFLEKLTKLFFLPQRPTEGWIKTLRKTMGLSQVQLAKKANCDATTISHLEDNESRFLLPHPFIIKAARGLGCRAELVFIPEDTTHLKNVISNSIPLTKIINAYNNPILQKNPEYDQDFLERFKIFSLLPSPPEEGWIRTLRKDARILHTLKFEEQRLMFHFYQAENKEISNKLCSKSTTAIAKALKCRIEYFLIPENPFGEECSLYKKEFLEQLSSLPIRPSKGWIYTMRKALKLSASELARKTSLHSVSIYHKENEERKGNLIHKLPIRIAQILGFRLEYFFVPECIVKFPR